MKLKSEEILPISFLEELSIKLYENEAKEKRKNTKKQKTTVSFVPN